MLFKYEEKKNTHSNNVDLMLHKIEYLKEWNKNYIEHII